MKDSLKMDERKAKGSSYSRMVISILVCTRTIWLMVKAPIYGRQGRVTKGNGLKVRGKAMESGLENLENNTEGSGRTQKHLEKEHSFGLMETHLLETSLII